MVGGGICVCVCVFLVGLVVAASFDVRGGVIHSVDESPHKDSSSGRVCVTGWVE